MAELLGKTAALAVGVAAIALFVTSAGWCGVISIAMALYLGANVVDWLLVKETKS